MATAEDLEVQAQNEEQNAQQLRDEAANLSRQADEKNGEADKAIDRANDLRAQAARQRQIDNNEQKTGGGGLF